MVILYAFHEQIGKILQLRQLPNIGRWWRNVRRQRPKVSVLAGTIYDQVVELKPRGLQSFGLRRRKPREVFEEEDGMSVRSINGERMSQSQKRK